MDTQTPHADVYVRLRPSPIHGIGCFAIRDIPAGAEICSESSDEMVWIPKASLGDLPAEIKKLYDDFCVERDGLIGCPRSFNCMDTSWYFNHSKTPNAFCDPARSYSFYTLREIRAGEEVTVDYNRYEVL